MSVKHIIDEPEFVTQVMLPAQQPTVAQVLKNAWGNLVSDFRNMYFDIAKPKPKVMPPPEVPAPPVDYRKENVNIILP
jgi:hypothetical protein